MLKQDVIGIVEAHTAPADSSDPAVMVEMSSTAKKLEGYAHLFKEKEINNFNALI